MELRAVNPKKLKLNPDNPRRTKASPEADAALAANIKAIGLIQPPFVRELDGKLVVKAGERRVKASIAAGLAEIHVIVASGEDEADPLRSLAENVQRAQMGPVDQWRAIEALCGGGWTEEAIGTAFTMPVRTIWPVGGPGAEHSVTRLRAGSTVLMKVAGLLIGRFGRHSSACQILES